MSIIYDKIVFCPVCSMPIDAARPITGVDVPVPGDLTVCFGCASLLVFDQPPTLHEMTDTELANLDEEEYEALRSIQQKLEK